MPTLVGSTLDRYEILEEVGHGGMAVVYRALDVVLKREVAVKVLHPHLANRQESRLRLEREAIAVAKLRHDNILEIFDYSGAQSDAGESYIVTEFIHGPTLKAWLDEGYPARPAIAALVVYHLCCALDHAHRVGIVHRDIKPENVMIRSADGCLKLMDFGIAQLLDNQKLTLTGQLIGSPAYMAPELIQGRPLDARTDLFAVGILLYQLATQRLPFDGRNPHEVLNRIADGSYTPPSSIDPRIDPDLEAIIERALAVDPFRRYQCAETFAHELEAYLAEHGIDAHTANLSQYFLDPHAFVEALDAQVVEALLERAEHAQRSGDRGRTFALLARVLEFAPDHTHARQMLARLRARAQRRRQLSYAVASCGAVLLAAGGSLWWTHKEPQSLEAPRSDETPTMSQALVGNSAASVTVPAQPVPARVAPEDPVEDPPQPVGGTSSTEAEPDADASRSRPLASDLAERARKARALRREQAESVKEATSCRIHLEGLSPSTAKNLALQVDRRRIAIPAPTMQVEFFGNEGDLVLDDQRYRARHKLTRAECQAGTVAIPVSRPPAVVEFEHAPPDLTIKCLAGCASEDIGQNRSPTQLEPITVPKKAASVRVKWELRADGYRLATKSALLYPGVNKLRFDLEPHDM